MEEAIEICKLRLFLKLVAQIDNVENIEPLPDIDFNIRAGNTLVGFANLEEIKKAMEGDWIKLQSLPIVKNPAAETAGCINYKDFDMEKYIEFDKKLNKFFSTGEFEEDTDAEQYIDEYNNDIFWEELIDRLARRDFIRAYGEENLLKMTWEERFKKEQPFIDKYDEDFEKYGIERLES